MTAVKAVLVLVGAVLVSGELSAQTAPFKVGQTVVWTYNDMNTCDTSMDKNFLCLLGEGIDQIRVGAAGGNIYRAGKLNKIHSYDPETGMMKVEFELRHGQDKEVRRVTHTINTKDGSMASMSPAGIGKVELSVKGQKTKDRIEVGTLVKAAGLKGWFSETSFRVVGFAPPDAVCVLKVNADPSQVPFCENPKSFVLEPVDGKKGSDAPGSGSAPRKTDN